MIISLNKIPFIIGKISDLVNFILVKSPKTSPSKIILPCSLNDLALKNNIQYQRNYQKIDYCTNDSMFITRYLEYKNKIKIERIYGPDLMNQALKKSHKKKLALKHYFLAPNQENMIKLERVIKKKYNQTKTTFGFLPKHADKKQELSFLQKIPLAKIDVLWIGVGSPKQIELASYIKSNSKSINIICVGAAFDFISGNKKQAPIWIRKCGLEWLFRLLSEPQRLWYRYLIVIPKYLIMLIFKKLTKTL